MSGGVRKGTVPGPVSVHSLGADVVGISSIRTVLAHSAAMVSRSSMVMTAYEF